MTVLNLEHLAETAASLQRADDPLAHRRAGERVLGAVHLETLKQLEENGHLRRP